MKIVRKFRYGILFCMLFLLLQGTVSVYGTETDSVKKGWVVSNNVRYYYVNNKPVKGWKVINNKKYYFQTTGKKKGQMITGWKKIGGNRYYFSKAASTKGQMVTGWQKIAGKKYYFVKSGKNKGSMVTGWYKIGKLAYHFKTDGKYDNRTLNNVAETDKWGTAEQKVKWRADMLVDKVAGSAVNANEKLRICYDYLMKNNGFSNQRIPHYKGTDWPVIYANDIFLSKTGNCFSYASAFAYMAAALGYRNVYCCHSGIHAWVEINGLVYDITNDLQGWNGYALTYSESDPSLANAMNNRTAEYMYIKIA